jgi:muramoyltetrapeptide carboxypeptidase LdcA involved in peptidoglycan recycling
MEREGPLDERAPAMVEFAQQPDGLHPAEGLLDELPFSLTDVVAGMDFGHTDPMFVLPYGVTAEIDCEARSFSITEAAVSE